MDFAERIRIVHECTELVHRYTHYADLGMRSRIPGLFTEDGVLGFPGEPLRGQEVLQAHFKINDPDRTTVHVCTNTVIDVLGQDAAQGITYLTVYAHEGPIPPGMPAPAPIRVGHYEDQFVRTPEGWRFQERRVVFRFGQRTGQERIREEKSS
jgi:hypothetical protein